MYKKPKKSRKNTLPNSSVLHSPIVIGIGGSAGGLEAFSDFLKNLPDTTGMAFVFISHLSPDHKSQLTELLSRETKMQVNEAVDGMLLESNHVYVIPSKTNMTISGGKLILVAQKTTELIRMPIDCFFCSLAEEQGNKAIGIIFSGTASDGTHGAEAIKAAGGITFVQDEKSAKFYGMPQSAIDAGCADFVLSPKKIVMELLYILKHPYICGYKIREKQIDTKVDETICQKTPENKVYEKIFTKLSLDKGLDLTYYKSSTINRRILRRMVLLKLHKLDSYEKLLHKNNNEVEKLYDDLLLNVTGFFRDSKVFIQLKNQVIPAIFNNKIKDETIRVWVPGCSTGEEAYSIAICISEEIENNMRINPIQIFATDVNQNNIDKARHGIYSKKIEEQVTPVRLRRYFSKVGDSYKVTKQLRELCVFSKQNVFNDPPFSNIDIISCRNLLIYLQPVLQKRIFNNFHHSLNSNGFLLLGNSESIGDCSNLFKTHNTNLKIYTKKHTEKRTEFKLTSTYLSPAKLEIPERAYLSKGIKTDIESIVDDAVLSQFAPCGVLIDCNMEVLHFRGQTSRYLGQGIGKPSFDIFKLIHEGLDIPLRTAIYEAKKTKTKIEKELNNVSVGPSGSTMNVNITVIPLKSKAFKEDMFLVLFDETAVDKTIKNQNNRSIPLKEEKYIDSILQELKETKIYLEAVLEEHESANEEVKTANEEILLSNEELQSTNEELETSKEELQSTNEELATTNQELLNRNTEVSLLNNDLINLLSSINMPIIMMDTDLVIRRITTQTDSVLNIINSDIGRSISKIKLNVNIPNFEKKLINVIETLQPQTLEIKSNDEKGYSVYIRPYRTIDNKIDGVIAIFVDITEQLKAKKIVENARVYAENIVETINESLLVLNSDLKVISANRAFYKIFQANPKSTCGRFVYELGNRQWDIPSLRHLLEDILPYKYAIDNYEIEHEFENIGKKTMILSARRISEMQMILITIEDITERKRAYEREMLANRVLNRLNYSEEGIVTIIRDILEMIRESTKIEALGLRLSEEDDFPYYQTSGFPVQFVKKECYLCERDNAGDLVRDAQGYPVLECMCGNILRGRTDAKFPFFTEGGSFWSNCTTDLLASTTEEERQVRTRNTCNREGYESVALIPLRSDNKIIGLLQFNDHRKNRFTPEMLTFFERLSVNIGLAFSREKANIEVLSLSKFPSENPSPVLRITVDGKLLYCNEACMKLSVVGLHLHPGKIVPPIFMNIVKQISDMNENEIELKLGESIYLFKASVIPKTNYINLYGIDITEKKHNDRLVLELNNQQQAMLAASPIMIFYKDKENRFIRVNEAFAKANRMLKSDMVGKTMWELYPKEIADHYWKDDKEVFTTNKSKLNIIEKMITPNEVLDVHTDKFPSRDSDGNVIGVIGFVQDISELTAKEKELKEQYIKMEHLATFDNLTGIANRYTFQKSTNLIFQTAKRNKRKFAILLVDIDNFKWINDQYGHGVGDLVLQYSASIINQGIREGDLLARLGGDEFGIILSDIENVNDAGIAADKIIKLFTKPLEIKGHLITSSVSVGIACYPADDINDYDTLLKQADMAMYKAKESGRNCFDFFSKKMRIEYYENQEIEYRLRHSLKKNKFYLLYQPIVNMSSKSIIGIEALLRMPKSSKIGEIGPAVFIPIAEKLNIIQDIGLLVFEKVCSDINKWTKKGIKDIFYSINVSPKQMSMENFWRNFKSVLYEYNIDPKFIELEITETLFGAGFDNYIDEWLKNFKKLNLKLSIDDFGTGYSSLGRLGILPMDTIKIDGSFVRNIGKSEKNDSIIINIIHLADNLSAKTIAECVETKEQADFLLKNGCNIAQGYYYHKPMSDDEIFKLLK
jgi:two-component system, chemotaxis family, CheB/CheR fusion protein